MIIASETSLSVTSLAQIAFPVYKLRTSKPNFDEGVHYYYYEKYDEETDRINVILRVLDDKTVEGETLARRRLMLTASGVPLYKIKHSIFFLGDFIKVAQASIWFIDSLGRIFNYKKVSRAKLKCHRISKLFHVKTGGAIIEVEGISTRFKSLFPPNLDEKYAGILHLNKSLILYGYYTQPYEDTWRLI